MVLLAASYSPLISTASSPVFPSGAFYKAPITLTNSQSAQVTSGTPILLSIDWSAFGSILSPNLANAQFTDANGVPIYAWCESSCAGSSTASYVWVKLDSPIAASGGTQTIYVIFYSLSTNEFSPTGSWGEYPMASSPYGANDNGPKVFSFYDNFAGTSLNANLWTCTNSCIINNGLKLSTVTTYLVSKTTFNPSLYTDYSYGNITDTTTYDQIGWIPSGGTGLGMQAVSHMTNQYELTNYYGTGTQCSASYTSMVIANGNYLFGVTDTATESNANSNHGTIYANTGCFLLDTTNNIAFLCQQASNGIVTANWALAALNPPNDVMPSYSVGSASVIVPPPPPLASNLVAELVRTIEFVVPSMMLILATLFLAVKIGLSGPALAFVFFVIVMVVGIVGSQFGFIPVYISVLVGIFAIVGMIATAKGAS